MFKALVLEQSNKNTLSSIQQLEESSLPDGEVLVAVKYSSLNYKDGLAITGKGKVVKNFPMIPGIDYSGEVLESSSPDFQPGDSVIMTGWGAGETHWGGMSERVRVKADHLVSMPVNMDSRKAMIVGTAGLTAMLCIMDLEAAGITPDKGDILVTGASGGVGSMSVNLLSKLGYTVVAVSGRSENTDWLKSIGAERVIARDSMLVPARALESQLWSGAIDTVGSKVLAKVLAQMDYNGAIAACGLAAGYDLPTTVMPFILRGVKLLGIDSVMCPATKRNIAWQRISQLLSDDMYDTVSSEITLKQVTGVAEAITLGKVTGRTLVKI